MNYKVVIPGRLPNLNDYTKACRGSRGHLLGAIMKHDAQTTCETYILMDWRGLKISSKVNLHYTYYEPNMSRDKDNISSFAHKVFQDALVGLGIIQNDGWKNIEGFTDSFKVDKENPRIEVVIEEVD